MPIIFLIEQDTKSYGVKIENIELVIVQKLKKIFVKGNNILCVEPLFFWVNAMWLICY